MKTLDWIARVVAAFILLQTLYSKFLGADESIFIFTQLGVEPWGRYLSGVVELLAAILLLVPRIAWLGSVLGLGLMTGAIASHFLVLGIAVQGDGGLLFALAVVVLGCCAVSLGVHRSEIPIPGQARA